MDDNKKVYVYEWNELLEGYMVINTETKQMIRLVKTEQEAKDLIERIENQGGRQ